MNKNSTQRKSLIICLVFFVTIAVSKESFAQLTAGAPANFGIDGDVKNDFKLSGAFNATGTHDWFKLTAGSGTGVIDTTNASTYKAPLSAGNNIAFDKGMSIGRYTTVDGSVLLDARYGRDYFGSGGGNKDFTIFVSGAKNGDNPAIWSTNPGGASVQSKVDIIDAYAHFRRNGVVVSGSNPSHLIAYVGASTASNNGDRFFDAELFCSKIAYNTSTGAFSNSGVAVSGGHTPWIFNPDGSINQFGDMSLSFDFSSSTVNEIYVLVWVSHSNFLTVVPAGFDFVPGEYYGTWGGYGYAKIKSKSGTTAAWGVGNIVATTATPWGTISSSTGAYSNSYDVGQFGEAAIDLTALGIDPVLLPGNNPCAPPFTRILFKSRSSSSFTSALQDFAGPYEFLDAPVPSSAIGSASKLSCSNTSTVLSPQTYTAGGYYKWTTSDGSIPGNPESSSITVAQPGKYYLQSAAYKGCAATTDSTIVYKDTYKPKASASVTNILSIVLPTATLLGGDTTASKYSNANGSYQGLDFAWTGPLTFSSVAQSPITSVAGIYRLIVTEKSNGCKDTAMTNVLDKASIVLSTNGIIFTAAKDDKSKIKITWAVSGESINSFELYRSNDGSTFKSIAVIVPDATATTKKNNYTDDVSTLNAVNVFYKLKWTDKSGKIYFSTIIKVGLGETIASGLALWPNPVVESATVSFTSFNRGISAVQIIDFSGKVVMQKNIQVQGGINNIKLSSLSLLQKGVYTIRLINADNVLTNTFLKTN